MSSVEAEWLWAGGAKFGATRGKSAVVIDSDGAAGPSPMQAVAMALAGCMAIDVGYHSGEGAPPVEGLRVSLSGERATQPPKRLLRLALAFHVSGDVPGAAVERAIALSRDTYCSVWHSLRQDIELIAQFDIRP